MNTHHDTQAPMGRPQEHEGPIQTVSALQTAFNSKDVDSFVRLYAEDALLTNALGHPVNGAAGVRAVAPELFAGPLRDAFARYTVESVLLIRSDVAAVRVHQQPTTRDGHLIEGADDSRALFIMTRVGEHWRISASQNTYIKR